MSTNNDIPPYLRGHLAMVEHLISAYDMLPEDSERLRRHVHELIRQVDGNDRKYQKALAQVDELRAVRR